MFNVREVMSNTINEFETINEAVAFVEGEVREEAQMCYDNGEIDKYALEDILFGLCKYIKKKKVFEHPKLNICFEIEEIK